MVHSTVQIKYSVLSGASLGGTSHLHDDNFRKCTLRFTYYALPGTHYAFPLPLPAYYAKSICSILCVSLE